jgi:1-pyrroline-4-hydroxy-2-carboxylate deaminase
VDGTGTRESPWHGVFVGAALPFRDDLSIDFDRYAEHLRWLVANGCDGVVANGSLGEYQTLTPRERDHVVTAAVASGVPVIAGVAAYGAAEARRHAEHAAQAGAVSAMLLPPTGYRTDLDGLTGHYREVAKVGLPVVAYNNPFDTKTDLTPHLLAHLYHEGLIVAVKEFSGDVRRAYELAERAPGLDLVIGADDVVLELAIAGAKGWVAGFPNALPAECVALYRAAVAGDLATAVPRYRLLHPLLRWDSRPEFVQAIKLTMELAGRYGGPCRPPRGPLAPEHEAQIRAATAAVLGAPES